MKRLKRFNVDYNDINHAEIENILSEYGVVVDEMWGIPV